MFPEPGGSFPDELSALGEFYLKGLLEDTVPFWFPRSVDREHGGILHFRDARGVPCTEYYHDMKFWWPHNEAIIATLFAYRLTGDEKYLEWHRQVHDWSYARFPDPEHGEWFGYLHRDGTPSTLLKGNLWKGFLHLPRMQWMCWRLLTQR